MRSYTLVVCGRCCQAVLWAVPPSCNACGHTCIPAMFECSDMAEKIVPTCLGQMS